MYRSFSATFDAGYPLKCLILLFTHVSEFSLHFSPNLYSVLNTFRAVLFFKCQRQLIVALRKVVFYPPPNPFGFIKAVLLFYLFRCGFYFLFSLLSLSTKSSVYILLYFYGISEMVLYFFSYHVICPCRKFNILIKCETGLAPATFFLTFLRHRCYNSFKVI